jgi:hypothetical protein
MPETLTDDYTLLDINLTYWLASRGSDYQFFVQGSNLLDKEARRHTSFSKIARRRRGARCC